MDTPKDNLDPLPPGTEMYPVSRAGRRWLGFLRWCRRRWWLLLLLFPLVIGAGVGVAEYQTSRPEFCGSCHIMSRYHDTWEQSKHGELGVTCVECHYPPGEQHSLKAKFKGLGQLFSYLGTSTDVVQKETFVNDLSCTVSGCHSLDETSEAGAWLTKKLDFRSYQSKDGTTSTVAYVHKTHFKEENWIEGHERHCSICHRHESSDSHMEVSTSSCNLCHFKNEPLNEDRATCTLCHELPQEPFRHGAAGHEELVTHQVLEKRGVACSSCHLQHVRGTGATAKDRCLQCHENDPKVMAEYGNAKSMHEKHVPTQAAHCFNCHDTIEHGQPPEGFDHFDAALSDCTVCHATPHQNKRLLLSGTGGIGEDKPMPIKHHDMGMGCQACHIVDALDEKGRGKKIATGEVCANCHSEKEGALIELWKADVSEILEEAVTYETQALEALAQARGRLPDETLKQAEQLIGNGQHNLHIVRAGGGVHNKKYSSLLLDLAIEFFEEATDKLETD